jgi:hypothetical protein
LTSEIVCNSKSIFKDDFLAIERNRDKPPCRRGADGGGGRLFGLFAGLGGSFVACGAWVDFG